VPGPPPRCPVCATALASTRARYCSAACRQRAHRLRHRAAAVVDHAALRRTLQRQRGLLAHTVYACPRCETRLLGERRCPECQLFCRQLGLGGHCPDCETPILLAELLDLEVPP
jgi:predicted nucleic acid-binding Zn ribbon protein